MNEDHVRELAAIRAQLTDTHSQISAAHDAEITSLTASHAAALSDARAEHASELGVVAEQLAAAEEKARQSAQEGGEREGVLSQMCERLKGQVEELGSELERVKAEVAEGEGKKEVEDKLKRALGEVESMRDELEGTKSVSSTRRETSRDCNTARSQVSRLVPRALAQLHRSDLVADVLPLHRCSR